MLTSMFVARLNNNSVTLLLLAGFFCTFKGPKKIGNKLSSRNGLLVIEGRFFDLKPNLKAMKKFLSLVMFSGFVACQAIYGQVSVNSDGSKPDTSAMLDVKSTTLGLLIPRMTEAQRDAIVLPANGLMIYCTNDDHLYVNQGTSLSPDWVQVSNTGASDLSGSGTTDYVARWLSSNTLGIGRIRDNNSTVGINSAPDPVYRLKVDGAVGPIAIYGRFDDNRYGYIGSGAYGVFGSYSVNRFGYLGSANYGVFGSYDANHYGYVAGVEYGLYGYNSGTTTGNAGVYGASEASSAGTPGVFGYNNASSDYGQDNTLNLSCNAIVGWTHFGSDYHYGVFGTRSDDNDGPSAGVIGTVSYDNASKPWGALGFQDASLNEYAGYFNGNVRLTAGLHDGSGYGVPGSVLLSNGSTDVYWSAAAGLSGTGTTNYLPKWVGSTTLANSQVFDDGVNVGIGTNSPHGKLHFTNATVNRTIVLYEFANNDHQFYGFGVNNATLRYQVDQTSANHIFYAGSSSTSSNELMRIQGIGRVCIGTTTSSAKLTVNSNAATTAVSGQFDANIVGYLGTINYGAYGQHNASIVGYLGGPDFGAYGQQSGSILGYLGGPTAGAGGQYNSNIWGYFGSATYGTYGQYNSSINGHLGSSSYGAYGQYNSNIKGHLGGASYGAFGQYDSYINGYLGSSTYGAYGQWSSVIKGYLGSASYGAYGQWASDRFGYLGGQNYGVYGQYSADRYGYIGSSPYAIYGQYNSNIYGILGTTDYGVKGQHTTQGGAAGYFYHGGSPAAFVQQWATDVYMENSTANDGNSYAYDGNNSGGLRAYNYNGATYTFGAAGWNYNDDNRCGGVFGAYVNGGYWGALGYKASNGTGYGGYFTTSTTGSGKSSSGSAEEGIGIGAWGGLMGADVHGGIYGMFLEGENFSLYAKGTIYTNQPVVQLQETNSMERTALFSSTATDVTVMTSGQANLIDGRCEIKFDEDFKKVISNRSPLIITVTPMGPTNGVYIASSDYSGFLIAENINGRSSTRVSYIVIAKRAGYEEPPLAQEVIASGFEQTVKEGLHDDANTSTDGKGLYYHDGSLQTGQAPGSQNRDKK